MSTITPIQLVRLTRFTCYAPEAKSVFLAGTFNDWRPESTPMEKDAEGNWSVTVSLKPGRYEFKYVVDGAWCCAPDCEENRLPADPQRRLLRCVWRTAPGRDETGPSCPVCVPNPFGTMNCVFEVT